MNVELWLCLTVAAAGLWSGLLLTITTVLHPMFSGRDLPGFVEDLGRFLPIARRAPVNYVLVVALVIAPAGAMAALWDTRFSAPFVLTTIGFVLTFVGAFAMSRFLAEPNYDTILSWRPSRPEAELRVAQRRYFALNWARGGLVWAAFCCFVAATYLQWH
jgi:hypothetical protein